MDERDRMERRAPWVPWVITSAVLTVIASAAYMIGQQHQVITTAGEPVRHMHWGVFPGGVFFWILLFMAFGMFRRMWWCGRGYGPFYRPWPSHRHDGYSGYRPYDDERHFEEWHRREHERMEGRGRGAAPQPGASGGGDAAMT